MSQRSRAGRANDWLNAHAGALGLLLLLGMVVIFGGILSQVGAVQDTQTHLRADQILLHALQAGQRRDNFETCERSNDSRAANITNLRADIRHTLEVEPPSPARARYVRAKQYAIHRSIAAQASVAIEPGSPTVDCVKATQR